MELLILYLTDERRHYTFKHFIDLINESVLKNKWKILILTHSNDSSFYSDILKLTDISSYTITVEENNNYLNKLFLGINFAEKNNIPFTMKCDNDIFLRGNTLDYMINNLESINNTQYLTIGPTLSSGIPGIEFFKEQFLDESENKKLEDLFLQTRFYDRDGASYTFLNKHTLDSNKWDKNEFFDSVSHMDHHYKGIHPIRINEESLQFLNKCIIEKKDDFFFNKKELKKIESTNSPYLCNSIFCIKTDIYKNILLDNTLYVDPFDEVPLNKYTWKNNMKHLFVENGYGIHMYYNWKNDHLEYEKNFCLHFFK